MEQLKLGQVLLDQSHRSSGLPTPTVHGSLATALSGGDRGAAAQFDDHLLAVMECPFVAQLLQGAGGLGQHAHTLAWRREEAGREVAASQQQGLGVLPWCGVALRLASCKSKHRAQLAQCWPPARTEGPQGRDRAVQGKAQSTITRPLQRGMCKDGRGDWSCPSPPGGQHLFQR